PPAAGPLGEVQTAWRKLPSEVEKQSNARRECENIRDLVIRLRKELPPNVDKLTAKGISNGSQPFIVWRNRQVAAQHRRYAGDNQSGGAAGLAKFCQVFPDAFVVTERAPYYDPSSSPK